MIGSAERIKTMVDLLLLLLLLSTCLLTMPDKICHVTLAGSDVYIQTWAQYYVSI